jgi:hypothetical protein
MSRFLGGRLSVGDQFAMADNQPDHGPTDPTQQQDEIFRVFAFVLGGTIASLASLWTFAQVILFVDPFFLLWVPWVALRMLLLMAGVLILYLWDQFFRRETDGNRRTPFPLFILMFLMSLVALKYTSAASELLWVALGTLGFVTGGVLLLYVYNRYLYDRFFRRETNGNRLIWFPLFMARHPGAVLLSFAILMFLMSSIALKDASEAEIAQKLLADRGMKMSSEEIGIQLALLNHSALSLFGRAGIITDNVFEVLGQQSPYVNNGEPVVLDMIDKVKSIDALAQKTDTVEKFLRWIKGLGNGTLDRPISIKLCEECPVVRRSLLGYALSRGAPTLVAALMKEQASPFRAGYDPNAHPADFYIFDPFYYVVHNTMAFAEEKERRFLFDAFKEAGLRPSQFAREKFKSLEEVLGDSDAETDGQCVLGPNKNIAGCKWLDGFMPLYQSKNDQEIRGIDFAWKNGRSRPQIYGEIAIIEGRTEADDPIFLQIRQENKPGPEIHCPLQDARRGNAELFLVRADVDKSSEIIPVPADERFKHYTGIWDGDNLCLKGPEGENLDFQAVDHADRASR